jgi:hypothetical protein
MWLQCRMETHGGVNTAYDHEMVFEISLSNASPDAACVICASVKAGGCGRQSVYHVLGFGEIITYR